MSNTEFTATPSVDRLAALSVSVADAPGPSTTAVGFAVSSEGEVSAGLAFGRSALAAAGFDGSSGAALVVAVAEGPSPVAVGIGAGPATADSVRAAAAAFARAARGHADVGFSLDGLDGLDAAIAAQAVVEGIVLARYAYDELRTTPKGAALGSLTIIAPTDQLAAAGTGAARGHAFAAATSLARDLANSPHSHLNATDMAALATGLGPQRGLTIETFDKEALTDLGCGGLLGVNAGSVEPPFMIKLTYTPDGGGHRLALVGKGLMYDSGGLALKPGDEVHAQMKNDMSGAAAVFAAMLHLDAVGCPNTVTAWLMCTDNMPSGTAMALGDVITIYGGTTVEVINTDAEGRLVMADALVLAHDEGHDAIVDIATLTGACMRALGTKVAGVMGNDAGLIGQVEAAATITDEPVWELPLDARYRGELDSPVADLRNLGGANAGAITAALFLAEFVGGTPWAHIDIAGTAQSTGDSGWQTAGCTGFGARLLLQLATDFTKPGS